jgi:hypothetical protein
VETALSGPLTSDTPLPQEETGQEWRLEAGRL